MRILRKTKCILEIWKDAVYSNILILLLVFISCSVGILIFASKAEFYKSTQYFHEYGFDRGIMYLNPYRDNDDAFQNVIRTLENDALVEDIINEHKPIYYSTAKSEEVDFAVYEYGSLLENDDLFNITDGRYPNNTNEVILADNLQGQYKIGDRIQVIGIDEEAREKYFESTEPDTSLLQQMSDYSLFVVGFFRQDDPLLLSEISIKYDEWLDQRFTNASEWIDKYSEETDSEEINFQLGVAVANNIQFEGKNPSFSNPDCFTSFLYIVPRNGYSQEDLLNSLPDEIRRDCKTFEENRQVFNTVHQDEIRTLRKIELAFLLSIVAVLIPFYALMQWKRRNEMIVYYLYGCSWKSSVLLVSSSFIPGTLLGMLLARSQIQTVLSIRNLSPSFFRAKDYSYICFLIILVMLIVVVPFIFASIHKSPIELQRGEC